MIENDFSKIQLRFMEWLKLRFLKCFLKHVSANYFSGSLDDLRRIDFVRELPSGETDPFNAPVGSGKYEITDRYIRYCIYRRDRFTHGSVWPAVISGIVSLLVSYIIARCVTQRSIEQEVARQLAEALTKLR